MSAHVTTLSILNFTMKCLCAIGRGRRSKIGRIPRAPNTSRSFITRACHKQLAYLTAIDPARTTVRKATYISASIGIFRRPPCTTGINVFHDFLDFTRGANDSTILGCAQFAITDNQHFPHRRISLFRENQQKLQLSKLSLATCLESLPNEEKWKFT